MASGGQQELFYLVLCFIHIVAIGDDGTINVWQVTKSCDFKHTQSIAEPYDRWGQICVIIFQSPRGSAGYPIETIIAGTGEGHILQWREDRTQVSD